MTDDRIDDLERELPRSGDDLSKQRRAAAKKIISNPNSTPEQVDEAGLPRPDPGSAGQGHAGIGRAAYLHLSEEVLIFHHSRLLSAKPANRATSSTIPASHGSRRGR